MQSEINNISTAAIKLCQRDQTRQKQETATQPPSCNIDPVWPPLSLEEYDMIEQDTAKYFLYYSAILKAVADVCDRRAKGNVSYISAQCVKFLVLGCGQGRLVTMCLDSVKTSSRKAEIHALDANPAAVMFCRSQFENEESVTVHDPVCIVLRNQWENASVCPSLKAHFHSFDIIVSEVFGSFGDSEFLPEVSNAGFSTFAANHAIIIPRSWKTYLLPILRMPICCHLLSLLIVAIALR